VPKPESVDAYIAAAPKDVRGKLRELRAIIKKAAPSAAERISYAMPHYGHGGPVAYFALCKAHIGLYIPPPVIAEHRTELEDYTTTKSAVHLLLDKKLPAALITKLIRARIKKNETGKKK
jgi:uncharacterized protein YdhG (YjbR/CyaY superfamily)